MKSAELYTTEVKLLNQAGREFVVKYYINPEGYWDRWKHQSMMCTACDAVRATWRLEVYNHLFEPINSEYYCDTCVPRHQPEPRA